MVEQFFETWRELAPLAAQRGLTLHQVVTLASIVEKETGAPAERPLIASVFANRLARRMRLESDPTVIYGLASFDGNLRRRDLEDEANPYNTYRIAGLPPGPISNPGRAALHAVVEPAQSDYLYFVSRNDGTHVFSRNYRDHLAAVIATSAREPVRERERERSAGVLPGAHPGAVQPGARGAGRARREGAPRLRRHARGVGDDPRRRRGRGRRHLLPEHPRRPHAAPTRAPPSPRSSR